MKKLNDAFYKTIGVALLSMSLMPEALGDVELEDESENSIFHEVKGNLSFDSFYTSLGLYNGRHSTVVPIVSLPGNDSLEVAVYLQSYPDSKYTTPEPFALPMITGVLPCGYDEPVWRYLYEDITDADEPGSNPGSSMPHAGMYLHIPGKSPERMGNGGFNNVTAHTLGNYYYECSDDYPGEEGLPGNAPDFSMTINVYTPEGNKYSFDQMAYDYGPDAVEFGEGVLYASSVEDAFGNKVNFTQENGIISSITASDGREITFEYNGEHGSDSATVTISTNNRDWVWQGRWSYVEGGNSSQDWGTQRSLTLPDGTSWTFDATEKVGLNPVGACQDQSGSLVIKNPQGSELTLTLENIVIFSAYRSGSVTNLPPEGQYNCKDFWNLVYANQLRRKSEHGAVTNISISVPGVSSDYSWDIDYEEGWGREVPEEASFALERLVSKPDGSSIRYQFESHSAASLISNLISAEVMDESDNVLASYKPEYTLSRQVLALHGDDTGATSGGRAQKQKQTLLSKAVITVGSDVFTTTYTYSETGDWDLRDITTKIERTSVHGDIDRVVDYGYENRTLDSHGIYRIGLLTTETRNNKLFVTNTYSDNGLLERSKAFNSTQDKSYTYYSSGLLQNITTPLGVVNEYSNYKRGISQKDVMAKDTVDEIILERVVDDNGWVTSETDANGYETTKTYDDMGRITLIDFPERDRVSQTFSYTSLGAGLKETVTVGDSETATTYDGLMRSTFVSRKDLSDKASTIYEKTEYDALSRITFASWPSHSSAASQGIDTSYDALGRIKSVKENVTPFAETTFEYLSGDRVKTTDPLNNPITTTYAGYFPLSQKQPIKLEHPLDITTTIERNIWGQQTAITQSGYWNSVLLSETQNYYYDDRLRLCAHYTPETNYTLYAYDDAGRLTSYQSGAATGSSCPSPAGTDLVQYSYDNLDRLVLTDYTDSETPDISKTYDANSNLKTVTRDGIDWTYSYDDLNQITGESLAVDARTYSLAYDYNDQGFLMERTLPSGRVINYTHNGFGGVTSVKGIGEVYAENIDFHANGSVESMSYGNNQLFSQTLNARQMPEELYSANGGVTAIDLTYDYDANGNITDITDGHDTAKSKTLDYDDLGRLTSAAGPWGAGIFSYDGLGNIRGKELGSRVVAISYDSNNRASQSTDTEGSTRSFAYDSQGNVETAGAISFVYDKEQQPTEVSGDVNGTYHYDGNLKRVKSEVDGKTIYNVYDISGKLVHVDHRNDGTLSVCFSSCSDVTLPKVTDYVDANGATLARISNNSATYLHADLLGSPQTGTDEAGNIVWTESYTPYGEKWEKDSDNDDLGGFTGHISDSATGLSYMQARYYDPVIGRFYSNDPVGYTAKNPVMSFNRYLYVNNNPYKYTDPNGEFLKLAKMAYNFGKSLIKNKGNVRKSFGEQAESLADNLSTLADGQLTLEDAFAVVDLATGFGKEAKSLSNVISKTKDGAPRIKQTLPDGSTLDITDKRVKGHTPNTHPNAPEGTMQKVTFDDAQPGSKGYKRDPTTEERQMLDEARDGN